MLIIGQLFFRDFAPLVHGGIGPDLLQGQKIRPCLHNAACDYYRGHIQSGRSHQAGGNGFVTAGNEYTAVKAGGISMDFNHIGDHIPVCEGIIDPIMSLGNPVADIGGIVSGASSSGIFDSAHGFFHKLVQVGAPRMAVTEGAFHHDLRLVKIGCCPAHAEFKRVVFRCHGPDSLAVPFFHKNLHSARLRARHK